MAADTNNTRAEVDQICYMIHHSAPCTYEKVYYCKGKEYTEKEFQDLVYKKQCLIDTAIITLFVLIIIFRVWLFLKYGV